MVAIMEATPALDTLRKNPQARLALAIAAGVFGGLLLYRVFIWVHEWWEDGDADPYKPAIRALLMAVVLVAAFRWLRRRARRIRESEKSAQSCNKLSKLEFLFSTQEGARELDKITLNLKNRAAAAELTIANSLLVYAGRSAATLRNTLKEAKILLASSEITSDDSKIRCVFDQVFAETAALHFWAVMSRFWDEDEMDFWVAEDSRDAAYLEALREALEFADGTISGISPEIPKNYLTQRVVSYSDKSDGTTSTGEKFVNYVLRWLLPGKDPLLSLSTPFLSGPCMVTAGSLNPDELDAFCRLAHARA